MDLSRYGHKGGMELIQDEIFHGGENIQLAWTSRWVWSPAAMTEVIEKVEKQIASIKLTPIKKEANDQIIRHGI